MPMGLWVTINSYSDLLSRGLDAISETDYRVVPRVREEQTRVHTGRPRLGVLGRPEALPFHSRGTQNASGPHDGTAVAAVRGRGCAVSDHRGWWALAPHSQTPPEADRATVQSLPTETCVNVPAGGVAWPEDVSPPAGQGTVGRIQKSRFLDTSRAVRPGRGIGRWRGRIRGNACIRCRGHARAVGDREAVEVGLVCASRTLA